MRKILHVTAYCHAASIGGTERYILDLIRGLEAAGMENVIGWLRPGASSENLEAEGVRITALPAPQMRVDAPVPEFRRAAERVLETEKPGLLHFHTFGITEAAFAQLGAAAGIPYVFTYHSPAWTCRRETMLKWGRELCDGEVRTVRCSACKIQERTRLPVPLAAAAAIGSIPAGWLGALSRSTDVRRRLAFFSDTRRYRAALRTFLQGAATVWVYGPASIPIMLRNGAAQARVHLCPPGVPVDAESTASAGEGTDVAGGVLVIGYVGRVEWVKGVHLLIDAFRNANLPAAQLRIYGWQDLDNAYNASIKRLAAGDERIHLVPSLPLHRMQAEYAKLSLLAVPSIWMEMGPLVMLEAMRAGLPVFGSARIGQIDELRRRGRVIEPNTVEAWAAALTEAAALHARGGWREMTDRVKSGGPLRTMRDLAGEVRDRLLTLLSA